MGRNRDERIDQAILATGHDLVVEQGYTQFSVEALCERVGIAKTTLYKRWPARRALLATILARSLSQSMTSGELASGPVRSRLVSAVEAEIRLAARPEGRAVALGVLEAMDLAGSPPDELQLAMAARKESMRSIVRSGLAGGELDPSLDADLTADLLFGAVWGALLSGAPLSVSHAPRLVDAALAPPSSDSPPPA